MEDSNSDVQLALTEMRIAMEQSLSAGDSLDGKTNGLLAAAAIVLSVASVLQVSLSPDRSDVYWGVLILGVFIFTLATGAMLTAGGPRPYHLPIAAEWEEIDKQILGRPERDALLTLLGGYVDQIAHNENMNRRKARLHGASLLLLTASLVVVLVLVGIG